MSRVAVLPQAAVEHMAGSARGNLPPAIAPLPVVERHGVLIEDGPFGAAFYFHGTGADERFVFHDGAADILLVDLNMDKFGRADPFGTDFVTLFEANLDSIVFVDSSSLALDRRTSIEHEYVAVQLSDSQVGAPLYEIGVLHRATQLPSAEVLVNEILPVFLGSITAEVLVVA